MWTPTSALEKRLVEALLNDTQITSAEFSEEELLEEGAQLASSPLFGDYVDLVLLRWHDLDEPSSFTEIICIGLKKNLNRDVIIHAIESLVAAELDELSPFVKALDARASDEGSSVAIRVEAVAGLTRFALQVPRHVPFASSGILRLLDVPDEWDKAKLCRLASILHDQLEWNDAINSLKDLAKFTACSVEARLELGFVEMANAFRSGDMCTMSSHLAQSADWFEESARVSEDAPRARMYGSVARTLASALISEEPPKLDLVALNEDAQWVAHYQGPRAGAHWLSSPPEAELEWLPLIHKPQDGQDTDKLELLSSAMLIFEKVRSVCLQKNGEKKYRPPQGISNFAEKCLTQGAMSRFLKTDAAQNLTSTGRTRLIANISNLEALPGKH